MKKLVIVLLAFSSLSVFANADIKLVNKFLEVTGAKSISNKTIYSYAEQMSQGDVLLEEQLIDEFEKIMGWDVIKKPIVDISQKSLTNEELKQIIKFYQTPAGKKYIEVQYEITDALVETVSERIEEAFSR